MLKETERLKCDALKRTIRNTRALITLTLMLFCAVVHQVSIK